MTLRDIQAMPDDRGVRLDNVGIRELMYPIVVCDRDGTKQHTTAQVSMSVSLDPATKGAHLSRFVEALAGHNGEVTTSALPAIVAGVKQRLDSEDAQVDFSFTFFMERAAPVTGARAWMDYQCRLAGRASEDGTWTQLTVAVPVTTVCPCSKAISDYGAHNQRGTLSLCVQPAGHEPQSVWIEELVELAESCASSPVFPLLKRPDERYVTMAGYDKPVFVEDMARDAVGRLKVDSRISSFSVEATTDESIHNHAAWARFESRPSRPARWSR
jgi:GTP cyclohydrolase IB